MKIAAKLSVDCSIKLQKFNEDKGIHNLLIVYRGTIKSTVVDNRDSLTRSRPKYA